MVNTLSMVCLLNRNRKKEMKMKAYTERVFGNHEGKDVLAYRFETDSGYQLEIMTYGATILRYVTPDKAGNFATRYLGI